MLKPELAPNHTTPETAVAPARIPTTPATETHRRWEARHDLEWHRAETERLRVLVEFLGRPVHAHGGVETDPDIVTAYNLAVEAALLGIRRAALGND